MYSEQQNEFDPLVPKLQINQPGDASESQQQFYTTQPSYNITLFTPEPSQVEDKFAQAMEQINSAEEIAQGAIHAALISGMRLIVKKYQSYGITPKECEVKPHFSSYATLSSTVKNVLNSCFVERLNAWFLLERNLSSEQKSLLMLQLAHMLHKLQIEWKYENKEPFAKEDVLNLIGQKQEDKSNICFNIKNSNKEEFFLKAFEKELNKKLNETIDAFGKKYLTAKNNVQYLPFIEQHSLDSSKGIAHCIMIALMKGMRLIHGESENANPWEIIGISVTQSLETELNNKLIKILTDEIQKNNFMGKKLEVDQKYRLVLMIAKIIQSSLSNEEPTRKNNCLNFTYKENSFEQAILKAIAEFEEYCLTQENDTSIIPPLSWEEEPVSCGNCLIL